MPPVTPVTMAMDRSSSVVLLMGGLWYILEPKTEERGRTTVLWNTSAPIPCMAQSMVSRSDRAVTVDGRYMMVMIRTRRIVMMEKGERECRGCR